MISRFKTIFVHRSMPIILHTLFGLIFAGLIFAKLIFAIDRPNFLHFAETNFCDLAEI